MEIEVNNLLDTLSIDCRNELVQEFNNGLIDIESNGYINTNDSRFQSYLKEFMENHIDDYQYDILKDILCNYYNNDTDIIDEITECQILEESELEKYWDATEIDRKLFKVLLKLNFVEDEYIVVHDGMEIDRFRADSEEEAKQIFRQDYLTEENEEDEEEYTFEEIINRMANAIDYSDLYDAATLIKNDELRTEVEAMIAENEDVNEDVDMVYSIVTTDLLDDKINIKNLSILEENKEIKIESEENLQEFEYMLLDRLKSDCEYFLGNGNRSEKHLWAGSVDGQIAKMKELWNNLKEKPEWLTMEQIEEYAKKMGANELPSTTDETAEKEIQDMLDRSEKRSKELKTEGIYGIISEENGYKLMACPNSRYMIFNDQGSVIKSFNIKTPEMAVENFNKYINELDSQTESKELDQVKADSIEKGLYCEEIKEESNSVIWSNKYKYDKNIITENYKKYVKECEELDNPITPMDKEVWEINFIDDDMANFNNNANEELLSTIIPLLANQCCNNTLILLGCIERPEGLSDGGEIINPNNLPAIIDDYDGAEIVCDDNNQLHINLEHPNGTDTMTLFTCNEEIEDPVDMDTVIQNINNLKPIEYKGV